MVTEVQCKQADMDSRVNDGIYSDLGVMDYEEDRVRPKRYITSLRSRFLYFNAFLLFNLTFSSTFAGGGIRHHELVENYSRSGSNCWQFWELSLK